MARHRNERPPEIIGHGLDKPRLTDPCRALQHHRETLVMSGPEHRLLVAVRDLKRSFGNANSSACLINSMLLAKSPERTPRPIRTGWRWSACQCEPPVSGRD